MHINITQITYNARIDVSAAIVVCVKYTFPRDARAQIRHPDKL